VQAENEPLTSPFTTNQQGAPQVAVSKRLRFEILRRDNHTCRYCGRTAPNVPLRVDHVVPVALGGTDDPTNRVTSCEPCNNGKSSTVPDSPLVAQAREDAMRWQMAWAVAVAEAQTEGKQRAKDIAKVKKNYVAAYRGRHGTAPILPEGWEASVGRWLDLGLPMTLIDKAIASSVGRDKIPAKDRFAYFAGCCWSMLRELANRTQELAERQAETWSDRFERAILDAAVLAWQESWMEQFGCNPPAGFDEQVRKSAADIFPEYVRAGDLLNAATSAAKSKSTDLEPHSEDLAEEDEEDDEDPFHVHLVKSFYLGWFTDGPDVPPTMTPDAWAEVCRRAWAAKFAGYDEMLICQQAFFAGRARDPYRFDMQTLAQSLELHGDLLPQYTGESAFSQHELDQFAAEALADAVRSRAFRAEQQAGNASGWGWGKSAGVSSADGGEA
jgi:hypothetical protein